MSILSAAENSALRFGSDARVKVAAIEAVNAAARQVANLDVKIDTGVATNKAMEAAKTATGSLTASIEAAANGGAVAVEEQAKRVPGAAVDVDAATQEGIKASEAVKAAGSAKSSAVLAQLTTYIPTETIALWLAVQTALGPVVTPSGQAICHSDFLSRWIWFAILLVGTAVLTYGLSFRQQMNKGQTFKWPVLEILVTLLAFAVWALSLSGSPLETFCSFTVQVWGPVLLLAGTIIVALIAYASGMTVKWDKLLIEDSK